MRLVEKRRKALKFKNEREALSVKKRLKYLRANAWLILYRIFYFGRWDVGFSWTAKGVEIYKCKRGSLAHKFRISYPLKTIKGL